jgi:hypothetical protein
MFPSACKILLMLKGRGQLIFLEYFIMYLSYLTDTLSPLLVEDRVRVIFVLGICRQIIEQKTNKLQAIFVDYIIIHVWYLLFIRVNIRLNKFMAKSISGVN